MESSLDFFLQNEMVEVAKPSFKEKFLSRSRRKCIKLAKSSLGKKGYNFLHNNCETFANYCAYRKPLTSQIEDFKKALWKSKHSYYLYYAFSSSLLGLFLLFSFWNLVISSSVKKRKKNIKEIKVGCFSSVIIRRYSTITASYINMPLAMSIR